MSLIFFESEIADILYQYGEERQSRKIAKLIIENRPLSNVDELSDLIKNIDKQTIK